jgi:hypothetical protein
MAKGKFYHLDRGMIVQTSNNLNGLSAGYRRGEKNPRWTPGQMEDLYFLTMQVQTLLAVVAHLLEIVQNDGV